MKKIFVSLLFIGLFIGSNIFAADYFSLGKTAFNKKDYASANSYFVKALTANPNDATCRYYYAQTLTYLNNYKQAKIEYKYVTLLAPNTKLSEYSVQSIKYLDGLMSENLSPAQNTQNGNMSNDNYITKALSTKGNLVTWNPDKMPLKVYIDNSKRVSTSYVKAVKDALTTWQGASNGLFSYIIVDDSKIADINIVLKGMAQKSDNQHLGLTHNSFNNDYITHTNIDMYTWILQGIIR